MPDPLQALLQTGVLKTTLFSPTSRYHGIATATLEVTEGKPIVYLRRRFVPPPERFALLQEYTVAQGDRLDNLAAHYLGDPEQFWRLCDANGGLRPDELTEIVGRRLRITLPEGIPGTPHA
jgi:phage tail protein X